jgi:diguanylate cyclase (GGDEF)-like protein
VATDSNYALKRLSYDHPDLIVIDTNLPGQSGLEICKILKSDFTTSYIPIILLIEKRQIRTKMLEIEHGIDDYLIKPPDPIDLEIRIQMALRRTEHQVRANALTKLPGSREIEKVVNDRIKSGTFSFFYIDIDNFKYFNDVYGYFKGDAVIIQLAHILSIIVKAFGNSDDFVGHVGGDDFVVITTPDKERFIASKIVNEFDRLIVFHYTKEDRHKRSLLVKDRSGVLRNVPLMSVSIAIVNNRRRIIHNIIELTEIAFEIKKYLKTLSGSHFLVNRRFSKQPKAGAKILLKTLKAGSDNLVRFDSISDKPIGQLLLDNGLITEEQLNEALRRHWLTAQRLGQILVNMDLVTRDDLEKMLKSRHQKNQSKSPVNI